MKEKRYPDGLLVRDVVIDADFFAGVFHAIWPTVIRHIRHIRFKSKHQSILEVKAICVHISIIYLILVYIILTYLMTLCPIV